MTSYEAITRFSIDEAALARIADQFKLRFIALFGSAARDRMTPDSDVDVAVWAEEVPDDEGAFADWAIGLGAAMADAVPHGEGIDLVVLNRVRSLLAFQVALHGILIHERVPDSWRSFRSYSARRYDDDSELRHRQQQYLRKAFAP